MFHNLTGWHFLIILAVVVLIFGAQKLPVLARSVGQSMRIFRDEVRTDKAGQDAPAQAAASAQAASATAPATTVQDASVQAAAPDAGSQHSQ